MKLTTSAVICLILFTTCTDLVEIEKIQDLNVSFDVNVPVNNVPADSFSFATIELSSISLNDLKFIDDSVRFVSNLGKFSNGNSSIDIPLDINNEGRAFLLNDRPGIVFVTATFQNQTKTIDVNFTRAEPSTISINPEEATISNAPGQMVTIEAVLLRSAGKVSSGLSVIWIDSTENGSSPGVFLNIIPSSSAGIAMAQYHLQDTTFVGNVDIYGIIETSETTVVGRSKVFVYEN